jgi:hypothetical protein
VMPAKDYASTRFSGLDQINRDSVKQLGVTATFSTGFVRGHEAAPLVVNNTMYIVTPFPNVLYALDLTKPGAPVKWKYEPKPLAAGAGSGVLRRRESRRLVRCRHDLLQHARQQDDRRRRRDRSTQMDHDARRHQQGRDDHDGAARRQGQSPRRQQWRRVGGARVADGAVHRFGQDCVACLSHRSGQGRPDWPALQAVLRA